MPNRPLDENTTDYVVLALRDLKQEVASNNDASERRTLALRAEFQSFLEAAQRRSLDYTHRDAERDAQLTSIGERLARLDGVPAKVNDLCAEVKTLREDLHDLMEEHEAVEARLRPIEQCKEKVEAHLTSTAQDHLILGNYRMAKRILMWGAATVVGVSSVIAAFIPMMEWIWTKK